MSISIGNRASKALWQYLRQEQREDDDPVFLADSGKRDGEAMTLLGIYQLVTRLARATDISPVRCSPYTCRHMSAVLFLRNGGNEFTLVTMLGHNSLAMTKRYVAIAEADIAAQNRQYSPIGRLRKRTQ